MKPGIYYLIQKVITQAPTSSIIAERILKKGVRIPVLVLEDTPTPAQLVAVQEILAKKPG